MGETATYWYLSTDTSPVARARAIELLDKGEPCTVFDYAPDEEGRFLEYGHRVDIVTWEIEEDGGTPSGEFYFMLDPEEHSAMYPETGADAIEHAEAELSRAKKAEVDAEAYWAREEDAKRRVAITGIAID